MKKAASRNKNFFIGLKLKINECLFFTKKVKNHANKKNI